MQSRASELFKTSKIITKLLLISGDFRKDFEVQKIFLKQTNFHLISESKISEPKTAKIPT